MWYKLRLIVPKKVKLAVRELSCLKFCSDIESFQAYRRAALPGGRSGKVETVRVRSLGGAPITLRKGTTDAMVAYYTFFHQFHLPPRRLVMPDHPLIWDLGANVGLTMAHLAACYPDAKVVGVEMDANNAKACEQNVNSWPDRCEVIHAGIWHEDGEVEYIQEGVEEGFAIGNRLKIDDERVVRSVALSLNTLMERCGNPKQIDYVKMDIEGAELSVLRQNTEWASRVRSIKVEIHGDYTKTDCMKDLEQLGFETWPDTNHNLCVVGIRPD